MVRPRNTPQPAVQPEHSRLLDYEKTTVDTNRTEFLFLYKKKRKKKITVN